MRILLTILALSAICLFSCKKDDKNDTTTDPLTLLTSKSWKPAMTDKNSSTNPEGKNIYSGPLDCEKDDSYLFSKGNKLTINKGQLQCSPNEVNTTTNDYSIDIDAKKITIDGVVYNLAEISPTQLKYYAVTGPFSGSNNMIFIFEH